MIIKTNELFDIVQIDAPFDLSTSIKPEHDILSLNDIDVKGTISKIKNDVHVKLNVQLEAVLPCARTLKAVDVPLDFDIDVCFSNDSQSDYPLTSEIDLDALLYGFILTEKPFVVYHESSESISDDTQKTINPAFADLIDQ